MRCQFIQAEATRFPTSVLCRVLQVSQSGYYAWLSRAEGPRSQRNTQLTEKIKRIFAASRQTYGSRRVHADLKAMGVVCGVHRVARLMRKAALRPTSPRRFVATTDSNHALPVAQNRLGRGFKAEKADTRWVSDITYLWTAEGWLYLAVILDLFSRRIVGACKPACAGALRPRYTRRSCSMLLKWRCRGDARKRDCCCTAIEAVSMLLWHIRSVYFRLA